MIIISLHLMCIINIDILPSNEKLMFCVLFVLDHIWWRRAPVVYSLVKLVPDLRGGAGYVR